MNKEILRLRILDFFIHSPFLKSVGLADDAYNLSFNEGKLIFSTSQ